MKRVDRAVIAFGVFAALCNVLKLFVARPSGLMWPSWALTYRHGFVRRALVGTLFQSLTQGLDVDDQQRIVHALHYVLVFGLVTAFVGCGSAVMRAASPRTRALVFTGLSVVGLSTFFTTYGDTCGYFDIYVMALAALGAYLISAGRPLLASLLACVGPFIHDEFLFLWLPVLVCVASDIVNAKDWRRALKPRLVVLLPVAAAILALTLHSPAAFSASLADLPQDWRHVQQFTMPLHEVLAVMADHFRREWVNFFLALLYYAWPFAITAACAALVVPWPRWRAILFAVMTTVAPCSILLVAWDLSRYLVWSGYGATLALFWATRAANAASPEAAELSPRGQWLARLAIVVAAISVIGGPQPYSYFEVTFAGYRNAMEWQKHTPAAALTYAWLRLYNRKETVAHSSLAEKCPPGGRNIKIEGGCTIRMAPDGFVESQNWSLWPGHYRATLEAEPLDECVDGAGELAFHEYWRGSHAIGNVVRFDAEASPHAALDFDVDAEATAMASMHVDITTRGGCFLVKSLTIAQVP